MSKRKVLYISHNHPSVRPGGAEAYALELYEAMRASEEFEPIFRCANGRPASFETGRPHNGTHFVRERRQQPILLLHGFVRFRLALRDLTSDKEIYTKYFHEFLTTFQPDVVHFQHTLFLGYDLIRQTRNILPGAAIVYTLHEFLPICHRQGQMVRTEHRMRNFAMRHRRAAATSASRRYRRRSSSCANASYNPTSPWWTSSSHRATSCSSDTSTGGSLRTRSGSRSMAGERSRRSLNPRTNRAASEGPNVAEARHNLERQQPVGDDGLANPARGARGFSKHSGHRTGSRLLPRRAPLRIAWASSASSRPSRVVHVLLEAMKMLIRRVRRPPVAPRGQPRLAARGRTRTRSRRCSKQPNRT